MGSGGGYGRFAVRPWERFKGTLGSTHCGPETPTPLADDRGAGTQPARR